MDIAIWKKKTSRGGAEGKNKERIGEERIGDSRFFRAAAAFGKLLILENTAQRTGNDYYK